MANAVETELKFRKRGRWLCRAGWALFAISLTLPAVRGLGWMSGWECFRGVFEGTWDTIQGRPGMDGYFEGFAVTNLLFGASILFVRLFRKDLRWLRRGALALSFATIYVASFPIWSLVNYLRLSDIGIGYYAWLLSYGLVTAGALHLSLRRRGNVINSGPLSVARTDEEMNALRELEDYLFGIDRPGVRPAEAAGEV